MRVLENKTVIVTGSSRGIGLAIVKTLAAAGANIIACSSKQSAERDKMYQNIATANAITIWPIYFDMANEDHVKDGIKQIKALKQPVDILVNNAGISHMKILPFTKMEDLHRVFQVNFFSVYQLIQGVIGLMRNSGNASIINMASVAGLDGGAGVSAYGSSKAALIMLTKVLSQELSSMKIRVNAVAPGMVDTEMAQQMGEKAIADMVADSAAKRLAEPEEVAKAVLFLASNDSSYVNGQVIRVDGGI